MSTEHEHEHERDNKPTVPQNFITACASIFTEKRDTNLEPSPKAVALRGLLEAAFTGLPPDADSLKVLQESQRQPAAWTKPLTEKTTVKRSPSRKVGRQREGPGYRTNIPILEGFALPDNLEEAERYVDQLVSNGTDEYQVWLNCQHWFATRGQ